MIIRQTRLRPAAFLLYSIVCLLSLPGVTAFNFVFQSNLTQCGSVEVVWQGGSPPFELLLIPTFDYPQNISLPSSAWNDATGLGSWTWQVNYPKGMQLVAMMSDATATGSGGVSDLYTVGDGTSDCSMRSTSADFTFELNSTYVNQCSPIDISWSASAVAPVNILGVIPHGQSFLMTSSNANSLLRWIPNMREGTVFILAAFDSGRYGTGGSSHIMTVSPGSSACIDNSSPSATAGDPVITSGTSGSGRGNQNATQTTSANGGVKTVTAIATVYPDGHGKNGLSTGAIAGISIAVILAALTAQAAIFWFCCRRQIAALVSHRRDMRKKGIKNGQVDLMESRNDPTASELDIDLGPTTYPQSHSQSEGYSIGRSKSRPELAIDTGDEISVSPFRDLSGGYRSTTGDSADTMSRMGLPLLPTPNSDPFWSGDSPASVTGQASGRIGMSSVGGESSDNLSLAPPSGFRTTRADSMDSATSRTFGMDSRTGSQQDLLPPTTSRYGHGYDRQESPSTPGSASGSASGTSRSNKANLVAQFEREERARQMAENQARARAASTRIGQSAGLGIGMTGSTISSSASFGRIHGNTTSLASARDLELYEAGLPSAIAPSGGINIHEDAGRLDVEDLPPMYRSEWEMESRRNGER